MPGIKGMTSAAPQKKSARNRIWQSMRIMRRFTLPDLCRTSDTQESNTRKFIRRLSVHGYIRPFGIHLSGRAGSYKGWALARDSGPNYPMRCDVCGHPLGEPCRKEGENAVTVTT